MPDQVGGHEDSLSFSTIRSLWHVCDLHHTAGDAPDLRARVRLPLSVLVRPLRINRSPQAGQTPTVERVIHPFTSALPMDQAGIGQDLQVM